MKPTKGRAVGVPNYKNELLINVVEAVLPNCAALWAIVAKRYQEASGELNLRDSQDIRRHFQTHRSLCNNGRKITGSAAPQPSVARCQSIWRKILAKSAALSAGGKDTDASDSEDTDSGTDTDIGGILNASVHDDSERPNIENLFEEEPIAPIIDPLEAPLPEQPLAPRRAAASGAPSPIPASLPVKRKSSVEEERRKSKNCRNNPRGSAGAALSSMADAYTRNLTNKQSGEPGMVQMMMMQMMQQQNQQQQQQQQQQQFNNQLMMMVMTNQRPNFPTHPSPHNHNMNASNQSQSSAFPSASSSSSSYDDWPSRSRSSSYDGSSVTADDNSFDNSSL